MAMTLHNQYPWNREATTLKPIGEVGPDEFVVVFAPRNREVLEFIRRAKEGRPGRRKAVSPSEPRRAPVPVPAVIVRDRFRVLPKIEALAVTKGEVVCENEDVIRNSAYSWSPMTADDIREKTGIEARRYTARDLEIISYGAAAAALEGAGREPGEIAAVVFCSCTSTRALPSVATWLSGQLGIFQTHCSFDLVAACAGFPYGMAEAVRIMQDVRRPVLLVLGEKFSDKIGNGRPSRMIFGDGASALVIAPSDDPDASDIEVLQTYASGPASQVNSIIWPNPAFDNDVTVWGPEVKALVHRYLIQMMGELRELPAPNGGKGRLVDAIDLVVPHQANRTMVEEIASDAGLDREEMYFNIDKVGNVSAASIPIAIHDAVVDGVIDRPMTIFAPGFGAGAVAGYAVLRIDPEVVVGESVPPGEEMDLDFQPPSQSTIEDVAIAFGG
jgi:3-oxoacyl-(acyl-carrier-protein) synthase III